MTLRLPSERTLCGTLLAICVALNLWFSSCGWHNSLREGHEFRQVQNALTIRGLQQEGWHLAYPLPLFGPPWSAPMEFPLYQACVAQVGAVSGLALEPAGRLVSLAFFYLTLPACFLLAGALDLSVPRRWLLLSALLLSPLYLYYARTVMIESTALCFAAWFLVAYGRAVETGRPRWLVAAALLGSFAALAKVTTLIVFFAVAGVWTLALFARAARGGPERGAAFRRLVGRALLATVPAVLVGTAWVRFSDGVKLSNPFSAFLASGAMAGFNFGAPGQRFLPEVWERVAKLAAHSVLSPFSLACLVILALLLGPAFRRAAVLPVLGFLAGPFIFANLHFIHDYYYFAGGLFLVAALAVAWSHLLDHPAFPAAGKWLVIVACLAAQVYTFTHSYFRLQDPRRPEPPALARALGAATTGDDVILVYGQDWNPLLAYYSGRRAVMVPEQYAKDDAALRSVLARLAPRHIGALVVTGPARHEGARIAALCTALALHDRPLLESDDTQCFLAERLVAGAVPVLANMPLPGLTLATPAAPAVPGINWVRYVTASLTDHAPFAMMHPEPVEALAPFGLSTSELAGRRVFNAHAPCRLTFEVPAGARAIAGGYGLLPEAYSNGHGLDGVRFLVELIRPSGERTVLLDRFLNPSARPDDRGRQPLTIPLPAGAQGRLLFSTLPGERNNISFNWAFWDHLSIR